MRRRRGDLLPIEVAILEVVVRRHHEGKGGVHGFALAKELAAANGRAGLVGHGTLYKALGRLERAGLVASTWEDAEAAAAEQRPRRRFYALTPAGSAALAAALASPAPATRSRTAPA